VSAKIGATIGVTSVRKVGSQVAGGAFLLFLANLAGITLSVCLVFLAQGYGSLRRAWRYVVVWLLLAFVLVGPLSSALEEFFLAKRVDVLLDRLASSAPERWKRVRVRHLEVQLEGEKAVVHLILEAPQGDIDAGWLENTRRRLLKALEPYGIRELEARIRIVPVELFILKGKR
jgi:hypothetical protein